MKLDDAVGVDRRLLLGGAGLMLSGCVTPWPKLPPPASTSGRVGVVDTHVHLFNASDLPVRGFVEYTLVRPVLDLGPFQAVIDLFVAVIKPLAMTVTEELEALEDKEVRPPEVSPETFARGASDRSLGQRPSLPRLASAGSDISATSATRARSEYPALVTILAAAYGADAATVTRIGSLGQPERPVDVAEARRLHYDAFLRAARAADDPPAVDLAVSRAVAVLKQARLSFATRSDADLEGMVDTVIRSVAWGFILLQPRSHHLKRYLKSYNGPIAQPKTVVNLLVDYSRWLHDGPSKGSSIADQIRFWAVAAEHYGKEIDLKTFAPYCPLAHAYDTRQHGAQGRYLTDIEEHFTAGRIAGLKFYPPMGFYALGNASYANDHYRGKTPEAKDEGIGDMVVKAWTATPTTLSLGGALDKALTATYAACHRLGIPILAHAGPSNTPAVNFVDRPDPAHWEAVARAYPNLHIMLGHFSFDARDFVTAMEGGTPTGGLPWAVTSTAQIIRKYRNVFVDLSYVNEILGKDADSLRLADRFFAGLRRWGNDPNAKYGNNDPEFDQIVYGSDWIMLQREADHKRYMEIVRAHMTGGGWPSDAVTKIFVTNGERFLKPTPTP